MSGVGVGGLITDVGKGIVIDYSKRKLAAVWINTGAYISTNLAFLPLDLALFGQLIPIGASNRFNLFTNHTDFLDV